MIEKYIQPLSYVQNASTQYLGSQGEKTSQAVRDHPGAQKMKVTSIFLIPEKRQEFNA
jgi:hypothetical protein